MPDRVPLESRNAPGLNAGGSSEDTVFVPSRSFSPLMRECRTEADRIIGDVELLTTKGR